MTCKTYDKLFSSKYHNTVSTKDRLQDENLYQLNFKLNENYQILEKIHTNFRRCIEEDVVKTVYLDSKIFNVKGQRAFREKDKEDFKLVKSSLVCKKSIKIAVKANLQ